MSCISAPGKNRDNHLFKRVDTRKANSLQAGPQLVRFSHGYGEKEGVAVHLLKWYIKVMALSVSILSSD